MPALHDALTQEENVEDAASAAMAGGAPR